MGLNDTIKHLRTAKGLNQAQMADILGVSLSSYQKYERDKNSIMPSLDVLMKIADYYGTSLDYLLGRGPAPNPVKRLTNEQMEKALVEGYYKLPEEYREKFLEGLRQAVIESCPGYAPPETKSEPEPEPKSEPDNLIIDDVKKGWQGQNIGQK